MVAMSSSNNRVSTPDLGAIADLPESMRAAAFACPSGDLAWRGKDLPDVVRALANNRLAIAGGEVWHVEGNLCSALIPKSDGGMAVLAWQVDEKREDESWEEFTVRSRDETLQKVRALNAEEQVGRETAEKLRYNLIYKSELDYLAISGTASVQGSAGGSATTAKAPAPVWGGIAY